MWGCGWGPYSSVTSSGSTSPRKWALKSSCRHDASTDSCSESKSSWVVRQGGGEAVGPQPRCPSPRSLWTRQLPPPISQPLLRQRARIGLGDRGVGGLGCSPPRRWAPLTSRTWSTISCMTSHWASVSLKRRSERNRQGRRWQQRQDRAGRACTSTALGAGGGLGAQCAAPWAQPHGEGTSPPCCFGSQKPLPSELTE